MNGRARHGKALLLLLLVSLGLRLALASRGGQRYFPDENRYLRCFILLRHLGHRELAAAGDFLLQNPDHTGFIIVGLPPALAQQAALRATGEPVTRESLDRTLWLAAMLLSLCSVASIALVYAIAARAGAEPLESLVAAFLMASSAAMFYYSRHLLPYDAALALALLALWLGLRPHPSRPRSLLVGLVAGCAFLTYNGYWLSAVAALALHALHGAERPREALRRGVAAGLGLAALPLALTAASLLRGLGPYLRKMWRFSRGAATQADFTEGWSLPWAYLWHAEHGLLILFLAAVLWLLWRWARRPPAGARGLWWLATAAGLYLAMVAFSNGLERIGTFGRLARQLVPFLCLAAASAVRSAALPSTLGRRLVAVTGVAVGVQAAVNFAPVFALRFPREVEREVTQTYGEVSRGTTVILGKTDEETLVPGARYLLLNARYLFPVRGVKPAAAGRTVFATRHPVQFLPYQYEGYRREQRAMLRATDVSMRLVDTRVAVPNVPSPSP